MGIGITDGRRRMARRKTPRPKIDHAGGGGSWRRDTRPRRPPGQCHAAGMLCTLPSLCDGTRRRWMGMDGVDRLVTQHSMASPTWQNHAFRRRPCCVTLPPEFMLAPRDWPRAGYRDTARGAHTGTQHTPSHRLTGRLSQAGVGPPHPGLRWVCVTGGEVGRHQHRLGRHTRQDDAYEFQDTRGLQSGHR